MTVSRRLRSRARSGETSDGGAGRGAPLGGHGSTKAWNTAWLRRESKRALQEMTILGLTVSASERGAQVGARCGGWSAAAGGALGGEGCLARNFLVAGGDVGVRGRRERRFSACYGWSMNGESLAAMSDVEVVARLVELLREERRLTAAVLAHLGEVEARRLYLPAACSSMHVYCIRVLGMSEDQAFKRI